jgi:hypothetical protein
MDLGPSILISSVTGALLFFSGGRFWGQAVARRQQQAPEPAPAPHPPPAPVDDGQAARMSRALEALGAETARALAMQAELTRAVETAARLEAENDALRREVEERRRTEGRFADVQRQSLEVATQAHLIERRRGELDGKEAENRALRGEVQRLSVQAGEVEELRRRVRDLESRGFAFQASSVGPPLAPQRPRSGQKLEEAVEEHLDALRHRRGSCQTAILSDMRGLLVASTGDAVHEDALAAAAAVATEAGERVRPLLPLGELLEIRLMDANRVVFTARWIRGHQETFLLGTLGVTKERADPRADAIEASIGSLLGAPQGSG